MKIHKNISGTGLSVKWVWLSKFFFASKLFFCSGWHGKSHPHSLTPAFDWPDILIGSDDGFELELSERF
jgi:hypothetical protein